MTAVYKDGLFDIMRRHELIHEHVVFSNISARGASLGKEFVLVMKYFLNKDICPPHEKCVICNMLKHLPIYLFAYEWGGSQTNYIATQTKVVLELSCVGTTGIL